MKLLEKIGFKAIELINEQVAAGIDADGKPYQYSSKSFAMPAGKKKFPKSLEKEGRLIKFTNRKGKLWQIVKGGYKDWRKINNRNPEGDFLVWSGKMLKSMSARAEQGNRAVVYFSSASEAQKAYWLNISGAGRSRKLWKFFGLTSANKERLAQYAAAIAMNDKDLIDELQKKANELFK